MIIKCVWGEGGFTVGRRNKVRGVFVTELVSYSFT